LPYSKAVHSAFVATI